MSHEHNQHQKRPNLLVTGASGNLGHWICRMAVNDWSVIGIHLRHPIGIAGVKGIRADLTHPSELEKMFLAWNPHAVIHTAAASQPGVCESDPQSTHAINVGVPQHLSLLCAEKGIPFLFTSTDLVFDGLNPPYDEKCPVSPVSVYGRQKTLAEAAVLESYPGALVCRMPLMVGLGARVSENFSMEMLSAIHKRRPIGLFMDEFRTPVDFHSAAEGVLHVLGRTQGLLHLGGRTRVSRFEMGLLMARQMDIEPSANLNPVSIDAVSSGAARSPDCSLNSDAAYALGYDPAPLPDAIKRVCHHYISYKRRES